MPVLGAVAEDPRLAVTERHLGLMPCAEVDDAQARVQAIGAIIAASVLTAALVLGEFAFAALLLKETLPTFMAEFQRSEPRAGMALALSVLLLTALIIWIGVRALRKRGMDLQAAGV